MLPSQIRKNPLLFKGMKNYKKTLEITGKAVTLVNPAALQPLPSQSWLLLSTAFDQDFQSPDSLSNQQRPLYHIVFHSLFF